MFECLSHATDKDGHPITKSTFDTLVKALRDIIDQYDSAPDGELGKGLTNGLFLNGRDALNNLDNIE